MQGTVLSHMFKLVRGNAAVGTALSDASYPASGSFVDVRDAKRVHILIRLGAIADAITFTIQEASAVNGTLTDVANLDTHTVATNDDEELIVWSFPTSELTKGFITVTVSDVSGNNYADILYLLDDNTNPAAQESYLPAASVHYAP